MKILFKPRNNKVVKTDQSHESLGRDVLPSFSKIEDKAPRDANKRSSPWPNLPNADVVQDNLEGQSGL